MVATFLNTFVNHAHIVKIANMAQLVNVIAPIFTDEKRLFLQTIYYPAAAVRQQYEGQGARVARQQSRRTRSRAFDDVPISTPRPRYDNGTLVMNVVNRHRDQPVETEISSWRTSSLPARRGVRGERSRYQGREQLRIYHDRENVRRSGQSGVE